MSDGGVRARARERERGSVRESEGVRDRCFSGRREVTKELKKPEAEEQRRDDDLQKLSVSAECSS